MSLDRWSEEQLAELHSQGLQRVVRDYPYVGSKIEIAGRAFLNFSSNNYLELSKTNALIEAAVAATTEHGTGSGASRLVTGTLEQHVQLDAAIAQHMGYPAGLVFSSGYLANLGVLTTLCGRKDIIFADKLVHATLIDGAQLSRVKLQRFQHNDMAHLRRLLEDDASGQQSSRRVIVTESVFSMDGDLAPLEELVALASEFDAQLFVDEAHAIGVFGPDGAGRIAELGLSDEIDICSGTFSKACGSLGGFVVCSSAFQQLLVNRARTLIYNTSLPPGVVAATLAALSQMKSNPQCGAELLAKAARFREMLHGQGFDTLRSESQIVPLVVGDNEKAVAVMERLYEGGVIAIAIRPPTVPQGTARIRFSLTSAHTEEDLQTVLALLGQCKSEGMLG